MTLLLALFLLAAWRLPLLSSVGGFCIIEPAAVWFVGEEGTGQIKTGYESNMIGEGGEQLLLEFERTDVVHVELRPGLKEGAAVARGDTVVTVASLVTAGTILELLAELEGARASYAALRAGARPADMEVAQRQLDYAQAALDGYRPQFERVKALQTQNFVSLNELQVAEGELITREASLELARSSLAALGEGARAIDLEVAAAEVTRLERALENARRRQNERAAIVSPVSGVARIGGLPGVMLKVERTDTLVALVALPESLLSGVRIGADVRITLAAERRVVRGVVQRAIYRQLPVPGSFAMVLLPNGEGKLTPGMRGRGSIVVAPRSLLSSVTGSLRTKLL